MLPLVLGADDSLIRSLDSRRCRGYSWDKIQITRLRTSSKKRHLLDPPVLLHGVALLLVWLGPKHKDL